MANRLDSYLPFLAANTPPPGDGDAERVGADAILPPGLAAEVARAHGHASPAAPAPLPWSGFPPSADAEPLAPRGPGPGLAMPRRPALLPLVATAAAAILLWHFAAHPLLTSPGVPVSLAPPIAAAPHALMVAFQPDAREGDIRELMRQVAGSITDGPSAVGLWQVSFPSGEARDAAMEVLAAAPVVQDVQ